MLATDAPQTRRQSAAAREQELKSAARAEALYARKLRSVASEVGKLARALKGDPPKLQRALNDYADYITPWAESAAASMLLDVSKRDERAWWERSANLSRDIRAEIRTAPTGDILRRLMAEQVKYIKSIPQDAARRVHHFAMRTLETDGRAEDLVAEILKSRGVSVSKANLIARTEVGRASTSLLQARALHVGSEGYIWRTALDMDVRKAHKKLEGKFFRWSDPPVAEADGARHHPGEFPNCRCYPEVVLPNL